MPIYEGAEDEVPRCKRIKQRIIAKKAASQTPLFSFSCLSYDSYLQNLMRGKYSASIVCSTDFDSQASRTFTTALGVCPFKG